MVTARAAAERTGELQRHGGQLQTARILVVRAVQRIAEHRETAQRAVAADLVLAAGDEFDVERAGVARGVQRDPPETRERGLAVERQRNLAAFRRGAAYFHAVALPDARGGI